MRVTFLGPRGTFTEEALHGFIAQGILPEELEAIPVTSPHEALAAVRSGEAEYACVALESFVDGPVAHTFDALAQKPRVHIYAEIDIPIAFSILINPRTFPQVEENQDPQQRLSEILKEIRHYTTHPVAAAQIQEWVREYIPHAEFIPATSNGAAAEAVAAGRVDLAAAPARAGKIHHLCPIAEDIADVDSAYTRFVLVGKPQTPPPATGKDRTALVIVLKHRPAALVDALTELSKRGVNLTRIESRPTRKEFGTYYFHIELEGHIADPEVAEAIDGLEKHSQDILYLGSWKQGTPRQKT